MSHIIGLLLAAMTSPSTATDAPPVVDAGLARTQQMFDGQVEEAALEAPFTLELQGLTVDLPVFFATVMPGEILTIQVRGRPDSHSVRFETPADGEALQDALKLSWKAPAQPGLYPITVIDEKSNQAVKVNTFVLRPASEIENGVLNGYRIGAYPEKPLRGNPVYNKPLGFIEVTPALEKTKISPHFTLGQFLCKQVTQASVKYVVLRPALLVKLEKVVELLRKEGIETDTLFVMSGYRTPYYNAAIGNVEYSRHVYGDAADIYVDFAPRDGDMDDLNRDGKVTKADAFHLHDLINDFDRDETNLSVQGGIGSYDRNDVRGPFVHIDVRGVPARWGR